MTFRLARACFAGAAVGCALVLLAAPGRSEAAPACAFVQSFSTGSASRLYQAQFHWEKDTPTATLQGIVYRIILNHWSITTREDYRGHIGVTVPDPNPSGSDTQTLDIYVATDGGAGASVSALLTIPQTSQASPANDVLCRLLSPSGNR